MIDQLLESCVYHEGSDLHIKADSPPLVRVYGDLMPLDMDPLTPEQARSLSFSALSPVQKRRFEEDHELILPMRFLP